MLFDGTVSQLTLISLIDVLHKKAVALASAVISRRWQAPAGQEKRKKIISEIRRSLQVPIYVFHDLEQKVEFKVSIKPCSHQPNCMKFLL